MSDTIPLGVRVPRDVAEFVAKEAEEQDRSRSAQVTHMLKEQILLIRAGRGGVQSDVGPGTRRPAS